MSDGTVVEEVIKIKIVPDQQSLSNIKKDIENLKKVSIASKSEEIGSPLEILASKKSQNKNALDSLLSYTKDSDNSLKKIAESQTRFKEMLFQDEERKKEIDQRRLVLEERKKQRQEKVKVRQQLIEQRKKDKENDLDNQDTYKQIKRISTIAASTYATAHIAGHFYKEKLGRDVGLASLAFETNNTVDAMKKLNYQAEIVGTSLGEIVQSGRNFSNDVFMGGNIKQQQIAQAVGINLVEELKKAKNPADLARIQASIYNRTYKALQPTWGWAQASNLASGASELSPEQAFKISHLNDPEAIKGAEDLSALRGKIGSKRDVFKNYEQLNTARGKFQASLDNALSTDLVKIAAIGVVTVDATVVNLITKGVQGVFDSAAQGVPTFRGAYQSDMNALSGLPGFRVPTKLSSAITKVGGQ